MDPTLPVDRVHFGLIYTLLADGEVIPKDKAFASGVLTPINQIIKDPDRAKKYETWSRVLLPHVPNLYASTLHRANYSN